MANVTPLRWSAKEKNACRVTIINLFGSNSPPLAALCRLQICGFELGVDTSRLAAGLFIRQIVGFILMVLFAGEAAACSCWSAEGFARDDSPIAKRVFSSPELILVHARVSKVAADNSAEIEVLEVFQGNAPKVLIPLSEPNNRPCKKAIES